MAPSMASIEGSGPDTIQQTTAPARPNSQEESQGISMANVGHPTEQMTLDESPNTDEPSAAAAEGEADYPQGAKFWTTMLIITATLILASLDINIVPTAVPRITDHFHTLADVGWYLSAYRLCACSFQFMFGKAYKLFSIKRVFLLANVISLAGSLLCGTAATSTMLVVGRAMAGLGGAGLLSGSFTILVHAMPLRRRPMFVGLLGGLESLAIVAAPLLGGVLTQELSWRWCFYINLPGGTALLLLTWLFYTEPKRSSAAATLNLKQKLAQLDIPSNLLLIPSLTSLFIALSWAGTKYPWNSAKVIAPLSTFAALLALFAYNQHRRGDSAALPPRILKRRSILAGFLFIGCLNTAQIILEYYLPTYYQTVRGYSPARSGYMLLPSIVGTAVGTMAHGAGVSAWGYYVPFMLASSLLMPIAAGLITTFTPATSFAKLLVYTGLAGLASGIGFSGPQTAVQVVLPVDDVPLGLSIMFFAQSFGPALAVAVAQVLFTNQLSANLEGLVEGVGEGGIQAHGLGSLVSSAPQEDVAEVLSGIDKSLSQTWYLVVGLACVMIVGSSSMEWRSVKKKRD